MNELLKGDLSSLDPDLESAIRRAATDPKVAALAVRLNLSPIVMIIALLASRDAKKNRSAARLARSVFHDLTDSEIDEIAHAIGSV